MERIITYPITPGPESDPPEEDPTPELPERERKHVVEAARAGMMAVALVAHSFLFAQGTPTAAPTTTPRSTTQQPATTPANKGWTMFNEDVGRRLELKSDQLQRLQEVDSRYRDRYTALGETPWTNAGYTPLTEQRSREVRSILTPEQYNHWTTMYGSTTPTTPSRTIPGSTGTTTPPTNKR
jgi:hypothetical protein